MKGAGGESWRVPEGEGPVELLEQVIESTSNANPIERPTVYSIDVFIPDLNPFG